MHAGPDFNVPRPNYFRFILVSEKLYSTKSSGNTPFYYSVSQIEVLVILVLLTFIY